MSLLRSTALGIFGADLVARQLHAGQVVALDPHLHALRQTRRREAVHRRRQKSQAKALLRHLQCIAPHGQHTMMPASILLPTAQYYMLGVF